MRNYNNNNGDDWVEIGRDFKNIDTSRFEYKYFILCRIQ